ncbi:hypothetical protein GGH94_001837 [Coemansia aciculifera]|uniref:2-hydroxyacyl-CoA lyase n=1 Tax=Coemansia aciculifera TaxID=417176 RepID=A0A9W8IKK1_9FUNG|nr:hypothetical protein GGH94_001837 [Coemansia aciculifera]
MASLTGAQVLAKALKQQGVQVVFGIVGIPVVEIADAIQAEGIKFIGFRNEQSCSYAASAWGYLTQQPGVCLAVSGPGVVHALAGIVHSQVNTWPMVLIGGACETLLEGAGAFQEFRQVEMCRPYTKYSARPATIGLIPTVVERAFTAAAAGRPGASYIDLPADIIQGQVAQVENAPRFAPAVGMADPAAVARAVGLLAAAKSPLLVVGKGAAYARAEEQIRALVDKYQAPFLPTPMGKGVVPDDHPRNVSSARSAALSGADVIVLLGARVNWLLHFGRRFSPTAKLIQIDVCPEEMGVNAPLAVALVGHLPLVVQQLTDALAGPFMADPGESDFVRGLVAHGRKNAERQNERYLNDELPMTYYRAFAEIKQRLPADVVLVSEGANTMDIARTVFDFQLPRRRLDCATFANMGVGLGYAIAAQAYYVESRVVAVVGDSAFGFSAMELETAVRARLPLIVVVINNSGIYFGLDRDQYEERRDVLPSTALTPEVRYELIAEAVGAKGYLVKTPEELGSAMDTALKSDGLSLINCLIRPGEPSAIQSPANGPHAYMEKCAEIERLFIKMATNGTDDGGPWTVLTSLSKPYPITVEGHAVKQFCFRITFYAPASPATAFDLLANVLRRPEWDELTDTTEVVQGLGHGDSINYVKMKAIWPTAARDSLLISHIVRRDEGFLNVGQSIEDSRVPEKQAEGIVRMEAAMAGQLVTKVSRDDRTRLGLEGENWCKVVQIADGDMKGWIPKSVIRFIATQAFPKSLTKVCKQLAMTPSSNESLLLRNLWATPVSKRMEDLSSASVDEKPVAPKAVIASSRVATATPVGAVVHVRRARWLVWARLILRYATPAIIAALTSLIFNFLMKHRRG